MKKYSLLIKQPFILIFIIILFVSINKQLVNAQPNTWRFPLRGNTKGPVVILKVDDFSSGFTANNKWQRFYNIIEEYNVCASLGIVATGISQEEINVIKNMHNKYYINNANEVVHRFEFWNHGYFHNLTDTTTEFYEQDSEFQYNTLKSVQDFFHNSLGFESEAFGPAGNHLDQNTYDAITNYNENNNNLLKVWFGDVSYFDLIDYSGWNFIRKNNTGVYDHLIFDITISDGLVDKDTKFIMYPFAYFKNNYYNVHDNNEPPYKDLPFIIIQIHPGNWNYNIDNSFIELTNIIEFLKSINAFFVTPSYLYDNYNNTHYCGGYYGIDEIDAIGSISAGSLTDCEYTTIHNGANVSYSASKGIYLLPGFKSVAGSEFHANIVPSNVTASSGFQNLNELTNTKVISDKSKAYIYPNPNDGIFTIESNNQQFISSLIIIYDSYGHEISKINTYSSKETIDLSNQPRGIYTIQVLSNKCINTYKIVKK